MAAALVLDAEALSALARPYADRERHRAVRRHLTIAARDGSAVVVPSVVLVELYRGRGADEPIDRQLATGVPSVVTTGARMARVAGHLLADAGLGSEHAVDALVVATAVRLGGGLVVTHDPDDLRCLAASRPNIAVSAI